jgi:hypothetical protein
MVVHYASIMAATSYLSWLHFLWAAIKPATQFLSYLPYVGIVFRVINQVLKALMLALDYAVALMTPIISAANTVLWGLQEGAWQSVYFLRIGSSMQPEAHSGDSTGHPYVPIAPHIIPAINQAVFSLTRGNLLMPMNFVETASVLLNSRLDAVQEARLHMLEVANSARQPWVAYGDRLKHPGISPLARHWRWRFGCVMLGAAARTEVGGFQPGGGIVGTITRLPAQVWSGERFQGVSTCPFVKKMIPIFTLVAMDQLFAGVAPRKDAYAQVWRPKGFFEKGIVKLLQIDKVLKAMELAAKTTLPQGAASHRYFWLSPYVYFAPNDAGKPGIGTKTLGNFAQPDVLVGLAKEGKDYNREAGAQKYFGHKFSFSGKGAGTGTVDFNYTNKDWPTIPGIPFLHKGLNAFAAAQVYYHRPGEWKEMPNFFNPLWGARLIPLSESNAASRALKLSGLSNFLLH